MFYKRFVDIGQAGCRQFEVLEPHLGKFIHNHVHNLVSAAEMVVETDGHAI